MIIRFFNKSVILAMAVFSIGSCNEQNTRADSTASDTASEAKMEPANLPEYDTSQSVTTISPGLYKEVADTLNIRMLEATYKPGDSSIMHGHPDFALYVLEGGLVELTNPNGDKQNIEFKKGMSVVLPAATHSAKNVGKSTLKLVVVEVNRPRK